MKIRNGFVTNSSSSSFLVYNIKNNKLYDFLNSLGITIQNTEDGSFSDNMEISLETGETFALYDIEADWLPTPYEATSISAWIMSVILSEIESVYPTKELDEYSDFTIALLKLLKNNKIINIDLDNVESWNRDELLDELNFFDFMDKYIKNAEIEFNTGFEGEIIHLESIIAKNGYSLSISMNEYSDEEENETIDGLKIFLLETNKKIKDKELLINFIKENNGIVQDEITDDTDYVICNSQKANDGQLKHAYNICIPVISEDGFLYRFGKKKLNNENLYDELFECTYGDEFSNMFYTYGIGKINRKCNNT